MANTKASTSRTTRKSATATPVADVKMKRSATRQFVAAKTGRVVKLSPATSRLGVGRIKAAVQTVIEQRASY